DNVSFGGAISGAGDVIVSSSGVLTLAGNNTYSGGTVINAGGQVILTGANSGATITVARNAALQIGNGGTTGSLTSNVSGGGSVTFNRSDSTTYSGTVVGSMSLIQAGSGTLILTGANTYNAGTSITAGTLQIGNNGTSGSISGPVTDNGTLAFNRSESVSVGA